MADNYLEKKMEEHRRGSFKPQRRTTPSGTPPGKVLMPFDLQRAVLTADGTEVPPVLSAFAKALRCTGCRVALCCEATKAATAFARQNSLLLVPHGAALPADFALPSLEASVTADGSLQVCTDSRRFSVAPGDVSMMTAMAMFLCLPQAGRLQLSGTFKAE